MTELKHAPECEVALHNPEDQHGWKAAQGGWDGDELVCTCYLKAVMARRAVYGDEDLIGDLPFGKAS